ncbi:MAG: hypothetical protein AAF485_27005, partial [Chloroflexota bacterium]
MQYIRHKVAQLDIEVTLILISLIAVAWIQLPRLMDPLQVDEDFRYYYWMHKFQDPSLFPNDPSTYYSSFSLPWGEIQITLFGIGFSALFYLASFIVSPVGFSKLLVFFLMPLTVWYLFRFGKITRDQSTGIILAVGFLFINLASSSSISVANGVQRSFALPLMAALIYLLQRQKYMGATITILLSALIYAPAFALNVAIWGIFIIGQLWQSRKLRLMQGGGIYLIAVLVLCTLILLPVVTPRLANLFANQTEASEIQAEQPSQEAPPQYTYVWQNPTYQSEGKFALFVIFPIVGRGGLVDLGEDLINLLVLLVLSSLIVLGLGRKAFHLPSVIWALFWASISMFIIAWLSIWLTNSFPLHLPSRYTRSGLYLFFIIFVSFNAIPFMQDVPMLLRNKPRRLLGLIVAIEVIIFALILWYPSHLARINGFNMKWLLAIAGILFGFLGIVLVKRSSLPRGKPVRLTRTRLGRTLIGLAIIFGLSGWAIYAPLLTDISYLNPPPAERELLAFLKTLPPDALIAGSPCILDSVELFAERRVLFSCEGNSGSEEALKAYYADDPQQIFDFCQTQAIDYLVVDMKTYSSEYLAQGWIFFEPLNQQLLPYIASKESFILTNVPDNLKLFEHENYFVMTCQAIDEMTA